MFDGLIELLNSYAYIMQDDDNLDISKGNVQVSFTLTGWQSRTYNGVDRIIDVNIFYTSQTNAWETDADTETIALKVESIIEALIDSNYIVNTLSWTPQQVDDRWQVVAIPVVYYK